MHRVQGIQNIGIPVIIGENWGQFAQGMLEYCAHVRSREVKHDHQISASKKTAKLSRGLELVIELSKRMGDLPKTGDLRIRAASLLENNTNKHTKNVETHTASPIPLNKGTSVTYIKPY